MPSSNVRYKDTCFIESSPTHTITPSLCERLFCCGFISCSRLLAHRACGRRPFKRRFQWSTTSTMPFVERRLKPLPKTFVDEEEREEELPGRTRSWTFSDYVPFDPWSKAQNSWCGFCVFKTQSRSFLSKNLWGCACATNQSVFVSITSCFCSWWNLPWSHMCVKFQPMSFNRVPWGDGCRSWSEIWVWEYSCLAWHRWWGTK